MVFLTLTFIDSLVNCGMRTVSHPVFMDLLCLIAAARKHTKQDSTMNEEWKSMFGSQEPPSAQPATVTHSYSWLQCSGVCVCGTGAARPEGNINTYKT